MGKARNILFIIVVAAVCFAVLGNIAFSKIYDSSDEPETSVLEARTYEYIPAFDLASFRSGEYQDNMEQALADKVPGRSRVLLENARVQRSIIASANVVHGFASYPTFFGSKYVYCPDIGAVYQAPALDSDYDNGFFDKTGKAIASVMDANPSLNWVYALPDRSNISLASPARALAPRGVDYPLAVEKLSAHLPESCTFVTCSYTDTAVYTRKFFKTDQHMQIYGALDFYAALMHAFGKQPLDYDPTLLVTDEFRGANARLGLIESAKDELWAIAYDTGGISAKILGKETNLKWVDSGTDPSLAGGYRLADTFTNAYAEWFVGDHGLVEVSNADPSVAGESLLVIGDSFDNNQLMLYARHYGHVYSIDPRHYEGDIQAFIDAHPDITDAAFTISLNNLNAFATRDDVRSLTGSE